MIAARYASLVGVPDFVLAGAQKAGTSTLWATLAQHPEIFMATVKEPHRLCVDPAGAELEFTGPHDQTIFTNAVTDEDGYLALFADRGDRCCGEASTAYLADPEVPQRLYQRNAEAKVVVLLREPVARAVSAWAMWRRAGFEPLNFDDALAAEAERAAAGWSPTYRYLGNGHYAEHLDRWREVFPERQILVRTTDQMAKEPRRLVTEVLEFLGADASIAPPLTLANVGGTTTRSSALQQFLRRRRNLRRVLDAAPPRLSRQLRGRVAALNSTPTEVPDGTRAALVEYFAPQVEALEHRYGIDVEPWR